MNEFEPSGSADAPQPIEGNREQAVVKHVAGREWTKYARVAMAALSSPPWVGSVISAAETYASENAQQSSYRAMYFWVKAHQQKLGEVSETPQRMFERFESFEGRFEQGIQSEEYLTLVRKTFHQWDHTETSEKKEMLRRLITNAGGINMAEDDVVHMFLGWIDVYHEFHFAVIGEIYKKPGITRREMWTNLRGALPRDDSEEADLFRLLIRDLSTGGVVRQERQTDHYGRFLKQPAHGRGSGSGTSVMESAFEPTERYELTSLGNQFVHYVLTDLATPLGGNERSDANEATEKRIFRRSSIVCANKRRSFSWRLPVRGIGACTSGSRKRRRSRSISKARSSRSRRTAS